MPTALRTAAAEYDLEEIGFQIAVVDGRPETARTVLQSIIKACDQLAELSRTASQGTSAPRIGEGVRLFSFQRWVIIFRYIETGVLILRIADGSQDYLSWKLD